MTINSPISVLHFADAHIDMITYGRRAESGLPMRVEDFLRSLEQIVETAVSQQVDLVIFAGDAYRDRNPQPIYQKKWSEQILRLSAAGIPTVLLVGNHDMSPAAWRTHTLAEFRTFNVPHVHVGDNIRRLGPDELGIPVQIITVPWVAQSRLMTREETAGMNLPDIMMKMEDHVTDKVKELIETADPNLPLILTAHASVQGAIYGSERAVMLGSELVLGGGLINDKRIDYVALGHIHKHQDVSKGGQPPIVYPGSIERIDFGEVDDVKGFVLAQVKRGRTEFAFEPLKTRPFFNYKADTPHADNFMDDIIAALPLAEVVVGAVCRLQLHYPRDWENMLDESRIQERFRNAFSFNIQRHHIDSSRARLGDTVAVESLTPLELLDTYWQTQEMEPADMAAMQALAQEVLSDES
jgi:exonuclease SbcD